MMRLQLQRAGMFVVIAAALASRAGAQQTALAAPAVGELAPDFTLPGATRFGLLKAPVHLADYRGETVVLAFFYQARTKG